ncbi:MAG: hypothetical protein ACYC8U_01840 [Thermoleophilia bacterium]
MDVDAYRTNRLIRSAVEREFITIGEAVAVLRRLAVRDSPVLRRECADLLSELDASFAD